MERWLGRYQNHAYALARLVTGLLFACHGAQKLFGVFGAKDVSHAPLMIAAGSIELVCGLAIAIGFRASLAAFIASGQMAYAYLTVHSPRGFPPIANGGEMAVLYCFLWLYVATHGAGDFSVDNLLKRRSGRRGDLP